MNCPACSQSLPEDAAFCGHCGKSLAVERLCSGCGRANPADMRFCLGCGTALGDPARDSAAPERVAPDPSSYTPKHLAEKI